MDPERSDEIMKIVFVVSVLVLGCGSVSAVRSDSGADSASGAGGGEDQSSGGTNGVGGGKGTAGTTGAGGTVGTAGTTGAGGSGVAGAGGGGQLGPNLIGNTTSDAGEAGWSFTPQAAGYGRTR